MLARLVIQNYAIIDEVSLDFSDGLTIITGETGAGKSILLGALELILGKRADHSVLKDPNKKCVIEAVFRIDKYNLDTFFENEDLDYSRETIVRRELLPSGKSRSFINDTPAKLSSLQSLGDNLIDMHRQFATQDINNVSFQMRMLDALADNGNMLHHYQLQFSDYNTAISKLRTLKENAANTDKALDFIKFQLNEFDEASIQPGEISQLEHEQKNIENAESVQQSFAMADRILSGDDQNILEQIRMLLSQFSTISTTNDKTAMFYDKLTTIQLDLEDLANEISRNESDFQYDEARLQEINQRLDVIYRLLNKHHKQTEDELLQYHEELKQQINRFDNLSQDIEKLESEIKESKIQLTDLADKISRRRHDVVPAFVDEVHKILSRMNMENARLEIKVVRLQNLNSTGLDQVQFLFATNPGSPFLPVRNIASGGELSRLTLAVKSQVADAIPLPTLIYDEIDTGISGGTAMQMGEILERLSFNHQVIVITHTPQVAVKANKHFYVSKIVERGQTFTHIGELSAEDRITAIARMLSGDPPSKAAIANAKELLSAN